jgi:Tol biopolymer transport system component
LTWFDRSGKVTGTVGPPGAYDRPALSPDGNFVAFESWDAQTGLADIWRYDLIRGIETRLTFNRENNRNPVWSPDSSQIAFYASPGGAGGLFQKAANGVGEQVLLTKPAGTPTDWSRDGRHILWITTRGSERGSDLWVSPLFGDRKAFLFLRSLSGGFQAKLSPDGRWLAYVANESNRNEIFVQSFPTSGGKWQISTAGGNYPVWSRNGRELFYIAADQKMASVEVKPGPNFDPGVPKPMFDAQRLGGNGFDVDKDDRFLIPIRIDQAAMTPLSVVVGWQSALKK